MLNKYPKPRLLIIGHGRHGKDTVAAIMSNVMQLKFSSSSHFVAEKCIWDMWGKERYNSFEAMFDDRVNYRSTWKDLILAWNTPDRTRTAVTMLSEGNDMYVGMRSRLEFDANVQNETFDHVIWVDASKRLPPEPADSMELTIDDADIVIDNNDDGTTHLLEKIHHLAKRLHQEGFSVGIPRELEHPEEDAFQLPKHTLNAPTIIKNTAGAVGGLKNVLLREPKIFAIGQTQMNSEELQNWVQYNDLEDLANNENTPLGRMWRDMNEDDAIARMIEFGGRHCYRAWEKGRSREEYISNIIEMEHGSVLEHSTINWGIQGFSRSGSLELARHRVGIALSQESQRYVDASSINFVIPPIMLHMNDSSYLEEFLNDNLRALDQYIALQEAINSHYQHTVAGGDVKLRTMLKKRSNEAARAVLPNCTETRFLWTTNMRLLLHFLWLRGGSGADLEIRRLAVALLHKAQIYAPEIFNRLTTKEVSDGYGVSIIVSAD